MITETTDIDKAAAALTETGKTKVSPTSNAKAAQQKTTYPNLASALVAFQADIPVPTKDAENPHFKSSFASLDGITPLLTKRLSEVGIAWSARAGYEEGNYGLIGTLLHEGGEKVEGFFPIPVTKPQDIGSAFTYARRYLLLALTGVAPTGEDDDGQKAQEGATAAQAQQVAQVQAAKAADVLTPLKAKIETLLLAKGDLTAEMDTEAKKAKIGELGQAFFGRSGWASSDVALAKWIAALENPEADPATGEVK